MCPRSVSNPMPIFSLLYHIKYMHMHMHVHVISTCIKP